MNGKAAKLLKRYALKTNANYEELKKYWKSLPWNVKHKERIRMISEISD